MDTVKRVKTLYRTVPMGIKISTVKGANYTSFATYPNIRILSATQQVWIYLPCMLVITIKMTKHFLFNHKEEQLEQEKQKVQLELQHRQGMGTSVNLALQQANPFTPKTKYMTHFAFP